MFCLEEFFDVIIFVWIGLFVLSLPLIFFFGFRNKKKLDKKLRSFARSRGFRFEEGSLFKSNKVSGRYNNRKVRVFINNRSGNGSYPSVPIYTMVFSEGSSGGFRNPDVTCVPKALLGGSLDTAIPGFNDKFSVSGDQAQRILDPEVQTMLLQLNGIEKVSLFVFFPDKGREGKVWLFPRSINLEPAFAGKALDLLSVVCDKAERIGV